MIVLCFLESVVVIFYVLQTKSRCVDKKATYTLIRMIKYQLHLFVTPANAQVENLSQNEGDLLGMDKNTGVWIKNSGAWTKNHTQTKSHCSVQETLRTLHVQCTIPASITSFRNPTDRDINTLLRLENLRERVFIESQTKIHQRRQKVTVYQKSIIP